MKLRGTCAALFAPACLALAVAGCKPAVRGLCNSTRDCRQGAYCATSGICLASSGTCSPACGGGEICSGSVCAMLKPVVSVKAPARPLSPAFAQVTVRVDAAVGIALHGLAVEVDNSLQAVASGALDAPLAGDNLVTLSKFDAHAEGSVSVRATLRYQVAGALEESTSSVAVPATVDAVPPTVAVFVPAASDAVNGWAPRVTTGTLSMLEVRATVDDGAGTGAQSATLSFDACPAAAACSYAGAVASQSGGATVFSFAVPRAAQAAGSEAPLSVTVKAQDAAGNQAQGAGTVQIDDAPPQIGALALVSTGVAGEDGKTWFVGGSGAPAVEIALPVADSGAGLSSVTLHLTDPDTGAGSADPAPVPQADGTVRFLLPASRVAGREGAQHFTLTAVDRLQHAVTTPPNNIWVDDVPPTVTAALVDYASAAPAGVCATDLAASNCGRRGGTRLLRDDVADVSFDVTDCGSGVAPASQLSLTTTSGGISKNSAVSANGKSASSCANGNGTHHYTVSLNLGNQAPALDAADASGTVAVHLVARGLDRLAHATQTGAPPASTGPGLALVSLWRWRRPLSASPVGSPALLSGNAGARPVVVATDATGSGNANLFALGADGSIAYSAAVSPGIGAEIAVDSHDAVYAVDAITNSSTLNIIRRPAAGAAAAPDNPACTATNTGFINPPALTTIGGKDTAVVASGYHSSTGGNLFLFQDASGACTQLGSQQLLISGDFAGVTLNSSQAFLAEARGFSSVNQSGNGFDAASVATYNSTSLPSAAPPSLLSGNAIFSSQAPDQSVRRTAPACTLAPCWQTIAGFTPAAASGNLSSTPVFDATNLWTIDDKGLVFAWTKDKGSALAGFPVTLAARTSPPVLLKAGALLVQPDGDVVLVSPQAAALSLWNVGSAGGGPVAPAVDTLEVGGLAYVATPAWLYALHVPSAPLSASSTVWPRPGRDSCNSRNAASSCQ